MYAKKRVRVWVQSLGSATNCMEQKSQCYFAMPLHISSGLYIAHEITREKQTEKQLYSCCCTAITFEQRFKMLLLLIMRTDNWYLKHDVQNVHVCSVAIVQRFMLKIRRSWCTTTALFILSHIDVDILYERSAHTHIGDRVSLYTSYKGT